MFRAILTCLLIAMLSSWLSSLEQAQGGRLGTSTTEWVRTIDGWEQSEVLQTPPPIGRAALHPLVVAGFQLSGSILVLLAFPSIAPHVITQTEKTNRQDRQARQKNRGHSHNTGMWAAVGE